MTRTPSHGADSHAFRSAPIRSTASRVSASDRWLRTKITSIGAGTAGRTLVVVKLLIPIVKTAGGVLYPVS